MDYYNHNRQDRGMEKKRKKRRKNVKLGRKLTEGEGEKNRTRRGKERRRKGQREKKH